MRQRGLQLIIFYKLIKAPVMLSIAAMLIFRADVSRVWLNRWALDLASGTGYLHAIGTWLQASLGHRVFGTIRWLALADGLSSLLEAILLMTGKSWGEWLVVVGVSVLIPAEIHALFHHFSWVRLGILLINLAVAVYLVWLRLRTHAAIQAAATQTPT